MRKLILIGILTGLVYASCESTSTDNTAKTTDTPVVTPVNDTHLYSCPMHPEVTGNKGDKCSKCGMDLTETAKQDAVNKDTVPPVLQ